MGLLIAAATPAAAQTTDAQTAGARQTSAKDPASAPVTITKADCSQLVEHVPAPDVAYQPGVDLHPRKGFTPYESQIRCESQE